MLCKVLKVRTSGYYAWRKRGESERTKKTRQLAVEVAATVVAGAAEGLGGLYGLGEILVEVFADDGGLGVDEADVEVALEHD